MYVSIGIAGTAKNTGKTTTTSSLLAELSRRKLTVFLTSIGYDGEDLDNITGLPKPKIQMQVGDYIATAEKCLTSGTSQIKVLQKTTIRTPLGPVCIGQIVRAGLVVTAGPNKTSDVQKIREIFYKIGPGVYIFDGALNRIMPMAATDGLILATGASRTVNIVELAQEAKFICELSNLPLFEGAQDITAAHTQTTVLDARLQTNTAFSPATLFTKDDVSDWLKAQPEANSTIYIPGIIGKEAFHELYTQLCQKALPIHIVFTDPIKLIVMGDGEQLLATINAAYAQGVFTSVMRRVPLLAVTVNPFYPQYRIESKSYTPALIDPIRLQQTMSSELSVPIYNIRKSGSSRLVDTIESYMRPWSTSYVDLEY